MNSNLVSQELEQIAEENNGLLRPADVVKFAEDPKTILHSQFEWDNTKAGTKYRLWQARKVIRLSITVTKEDEQSFNTFVSLKDDRHSEGGYRLTVDVLSNKDRRKQLLAQCRKDIKILQDKYSVLKELSKAFEAMYVAIDKASQ